MVTTLELAQARVQLRRVGREYHGPCPRCGHGPASTPATSDRLSIKDDGRWFCRTCRPQGGGVVAWLREFDNLSCVEAHRAAGLGCDAPTCPAYEKCPEGKRATALPDVKPRKQAPAPLAAPAFVPATVTPPADLWAAQAAELVDKAHAALLACPEQLAYLATRGLPIGAVEKYRLGWIPEARFGVRSQWGVPDELNPATGRKKTVWLPRGLLIPTFVAGQPHRLRIRRPKNELKEGEDAYIEVIGSGNDRVILNPAARGIVVVESDLDALLIDWLAGDLVGAMPLVSAQAKPKETTWAQLQAALCILVATDFEPRTNAGTGKHENPGGQSAQWWLKTFKRAKRWPTPAGKDPGEFYTDHGGDIRAWILAGLPPVFHVAPPAKPGAACVAPPDHNEDNLNMVAPYHATITRGRAALGRLYVVADDHRDIARLIADYPDHAVFHRAEMAHYQGMSPEDLDTMIMIRQQCPGSETVETRPYSGDGAPASGRGGSCARPPLNPGHPQGAPLPNQPDHQQELAL